MAAAGFETGYYKQQAPRSRFWNAALYLFIEQITVGSGAGQCQHQNIILNAVDEQPVRLDMAFPVADPVTGQSVVAVFIGKGFTAR